MRRIRNASSTLPTWGSACLLLTHICASPGGAWAAEAPANEITDGGSAAITPLKTGLVLEVGVEAIAINLGLMDGMQTHDEGFIFYEILVGGKKKEIPVAAFTVVAAGVMTSQIQVASQTALVKPGYRVRPARLTSITPQYFLRLADESFQAGDYPEAMAYYEKILELIPDDSLAERRIADARRRIADRIAAEKEKGTVPYYRQAMRELTEENNPAAADYARRILQLLPDDQEAFAALFVRPVKLMIEEPPSLSFKPVVALPAKERPATPLDGDRMVFIQGGPATIGENEKEALYHNEQPAHTILLEPFYIDQFEVTNAEYHRFVSGTGHRTPPHWKGGSFPEGLAEYPVVLVSWDDAEAYARWVGKRLPTEAEWEWAARGTGRRAWPWGGKTKKAPANTQTVRLMQPVQSGRFVDDISPFGVYDMGGNVSEWTADWYLAYPQNRYPEPDYGEKYKVMRGGSYNSEVSYARGAFRGRLPRDYRAPDLGFRCAASRSDSRVLTVQNPESESRISRTKP